MVFEFKYRIEFTGVHIKDAAKAIARYFNADVVSEKDIYKITDNMDRQWTFGHSEYVRAEGCSEEEEFYYQNVLETPMMYFPRDDDWFTIHDIFNVLRCIGGVTNDTCAMHIRTPFNFDHFKEHFFFRAIFDTKKYIYFDIEELFTFFSVMIR